MTKTFNRKQELRTVSYTIEEAKRKLKRSNGSIPCDWTLDKVIHHDFGFDKVETQADGSWVITDKYTEQTFIVSHNGEEFILHDEIILPDGSRVTEEEAKKEIGDLTNEQQKEFLENFDLAPIEKYISKRTGVYVQFEKQIKFNDRANRYEMDLLSGNLIEHAGVCKAMIKDLYLETFGAIGFYVDKDNGEQCLNHISLHFTYNHVNGGSNGSQAGRVRYDIKTGEYEGFNYETDKYETI